MKKITLFLCFSIVGLIGFAQQTKSISKTNTQEIKLQINIQEINEAIDQDLLKANDFSEINFVDLRFENNSHELVHGASNQNYLDNKYRQDAFSYNEYVLNFDFKILNDWKLKY